MPAGPVVANNTPLAALWSLGHLDLLRDLFGEVLIPGTVRSEFLATDRAVRRAALEGAPWIQAVDLRDPRRALAYSGLDRGEAEVLALAEERRARLVVVDERRARRFAQRLGFSLTGTLGILLLAKEAGLLTSVADSIQRLEEAGMHLSQPLIDKVLALAGETS